MHKQHRATNPLNHPDNVNALIEKGKEAMMKTQMKQMMKMIKAGIEELVMTALGEAAGTSPNLEGAAAAIADTSEAITTEIIVKAKAVLAKHGTGTDGAAPSNVVPMPFRAPIAMPSQATAAASPASITANGPPPFFAPGVATDRVPPPVFIAPSVVEDRGTPLAFILPAPFFPAAFEPSGGTGPDAPPPFIAPKILPATTSVSPVVPPRPPAVDMPDGTSKGARPCTHVPGTTVAPAPLTRKSGRRHAYADNPMHVMNPTTGEWYFPMRVGEER